MKYLLLLVLVSCSSSIDLTLDDCVANSRYVLKVRQVNRNFGDKVYSFTLVKDLAKDNKYTYNEEAILNNETLADNGFKKVSCPNE